jgi:hypothetical protein
MAKTNSQLLAEIAANLPSGNPAILTALSLRTTLDDFVNSVNLNGVNLKNYGAIGDGVTDDTSAVQAWLAAITASAPGYAPAGTYLINSPLSLALNKGAIVGAGPYQTVFLYGGASTTADIFTFGDGISGYANFFLQGFRVASNTNMTSGAAFHFKGIGRSQFRDLVADGQDGNGKLWHGFWFDAIDMVRLDGFEARGQADGLRVNGGALGLADLFLRGGKIASSAVGLRIGGQFGGFDIDECDVIANGTNVVVDQSISAVTNRELFFGSGCFIDSASTGPGISVLDPGGVYIELTGTWVASNHTHGISVGASASCLLNMSGGVIFNNQQDGLNDATSGAARYNFTGVRITSNGLSGSGYGLNAVNASPSLQFSGCYFSGNTTGDFSANALTSLLPIWDKGRRSWTPGIAFGGGTTGITYSRAVGFYQLNGYAVICEFGIILTSKGSSTGGWTLTGLPVASQNDSTMQNNACPLFATNLSSAIAPMVSIGQNVTTVAVRNVTSLAQLADTDATNTTTLSGLLQYNR